MVNFRPLPHHHHSKKNKKNHLSMKSDHLDWHNVKFNHNTCILQTKKQQLLLRCHLRMSHA